jgi:hypothetical protein
VPSVTPSPKKTKWLMEDLDVEGNIIKENVTLWNGIIWLRIEFSSGLL